MSNDLRYAFRMLRKNPGLTAVAVVTLALGIGANSAVFSVFDQVILRLLPVERPQELDLVDISGARGPGMSMSDNQQTVHPYPRYKDFRERSSSMVDMAARTFAPVTFAYEGEGERADGELVSGNFFDVLGVRPYRGRLVTESDDQRDGGHPVVVLSHGFWQRRFGGREDIIGQKINLNGHPMEVLGITPPDFHGLMTNRSPDVYMTLAMRLPMRPLLAQVSREPERIIHFLNILGRRKPGVSREQAEAELQSVWTGIQQDELREVGSFIRDKDAFLARKLSLTPALQGIHELRRQMEKPLLSVTMLVALVLLIACVNVAGLMMARALARSREIAVRAAMGATRAAIVRQTLTESLVLAVLGGLAGLIVASWTMNLLSTLVDDSGLSTGLNLRVMAFNFGLTLLTAILFGLAPAFHSSRADVAPALKDHSARAGLARRHALFRQGAVVAQVALSLILLVAAGLFVRTLYNLRTFDPGFRTDNLLTFGVDPTLGRYDRERRLLFYERLTDQFSTLPDVRGLGAAAIPVMGGSTMSSGMQIEGFVPKNGERPGTSRNLVGPGYFRTLGIPVVSGREFTERDQAGAPNVAIVNQAFVESYFPGENPLGRRIGFSREGEPIDIEIVGVVENQKCADLKEEAQKFVYTPYMQAEDLPPLTFYLLTGRDEAALGTNVRKVVREADPDLPVFQMETVAARRDEVTELERVVAQLAAVFAGIATTLAAVGLYGLIAFGVARRTREIGVRMGVGARRTHVFRVVLREASIYLTLGLAAGVPLALVLGRFVESQLFGLSAGDPLVLLASAVLLAAAVLAAALVPARRAANVNPVEALRYE